MQTTRPVIFIIGYYGFHNAGDEAILTGMLRELRRTIGDARFRVLSADPEHTRGSHGVEAVHPDDVPALVEAMQRADLIILGGGGLFHDYWGYEPSLALQPTRTGAAYFLGPLALAGQLNKRVMWYGIGIGPVVSTELRADILACAQSASAITVRDDGSAEFVGAKAIVTADPAWGLSPRVAHSRQPVLAVALRNWARGIGPSVWEREVSLALRAFTYRHNLRILLLPFQTISGAEEDDRAIAQRFGNYLPSADMLEGDRSPEDLISILSECEMTVAMRLHAVIFSAIAGRAVLPLAYDPKVEAMAAQLSLKRYCLPLSASASTLDATLESIWIHRITLGERLSIRAVEQGYLAGRNASIAADCLRSPAPAATASLAGDLLATKVLEAHRYRQTSERLEEDKSRQAAGLTELSAQLEQATSQLSELRTAHNQLSAAVAEHNAEAEVLREELTTRDELLAARDEGIRWLRDELGIAQSRQQRASAELDKIHGSRWWRLASLYWHWLDFWLAVTARLQTKLDGWSDALKRQVPRRAKFEVVRLVREQRAKAEQANLHSANVNQRPVTSTAAQFQAGLPDLVIQPALAMDAADTTRNWAGQISPVQCDVICFSIVDWDFRFQRPQQLMRQFGRHGHRVFYLKTTWFLPPESPQKFRIRELEHNVFEVELSARRFPDIYGPAIDGSEREHLLESLAALREAARIDGALAVVQVPVWAKVAIEARARWGWKVAYDCMDDWSAFPGQNRLALRDEKELAGTCDQMFVSGRLLQEKWLEAGRQTVLVRNGVDTDLYSRLCQPNDRLSGLARPVIGYFGAIADWFDLELLEHLATNRLTWQFVLLGGVFGVDVSRFGALGNVHLLGNQPYETMPEYLWHFDACIIPFKINALTHATDPVKFYEYLSAGKPVVSAALAELEPYRDYVYLARTHAEFLSMLEKAINETGGEMRERRVKLAAANTWRSRYTDMWSNLISLYPTVSIVLVTYGNLPLTTLCLGSVLNRTKYPNLEVIVVDNASPDGTAEYVQNLSRRDPRVKVIANEANMGFAHANNQGLALASGKYLVLLNNDTIVPPNGLTPLIRHLEDDQIGLVGPVTNFVGNEARLNVSYRTWSEMEQWASDEMWHKSGQGFDIPMVAFFCVAFRRDVWEKLGSLDEGFGLGMFEDDDYAHRARQAGYRVVCAEDSYVHHFGQASFKELIRAGSYDRLFESNRRRFESKWKTEWVPHRYRAAAERKNGNGQRPS